MKSPQIITSIADAQAAIHRARQAGKTIGFVPTMGALHAGHLSLVDASRQQCDFHVASIFVNPTQFGEGEDLEKYPRTFESDVVALAQHGVDLVFAPTPEEMYPAGFSTFIQPPAVANTLEGKHRPIHFRGVATIVLKLFNAVPADAAFFGEKDFQQCLVIQRMIRDLNSSVRIVPCPIVREPDGLAMSSRNRYLSEDERTRALSLAAALDFAQTEWNNGNRDAQAMERVLRARLAQDVDSIDYATIVDANTLDPFRQKIDAPAVALIAAHVGSTRLIDNKRLL